MEYEAERAVNAIKAGNEFSLTLHDNQARWEVNLGGPTMIETINIWNRTSQPDETSDFWIHVSTTPFVSDDLATILADGSINSFYTAGDA